VGGPNRFSYDRIIEKVSDESEVVPALTTFEQMGERL
jgi:hypothetical protein